MITVFDMASGHAEPSEMPAKQIEPSSPEFNSPSVQLRLLTVDEARASEQRHAPTP